MFCPWVCNCPPFIFEVILMSFLCEIGHIVFYVCVLQFMKYAFICVFGVFVICNIVLIKVKNCKNIVFV